MKKLTTDFVVNRLKKEGYKLLSNVYKNAKQKLDYICPNGHKHFICWSDWQNGRRCPYCVGLGRPTIEFIKREFGKENYKLLTNKYRNNYSKLYYICSEGHQHCISWNNWQKGARCPSCFNKVRSMNRFGKNNPNWKGGISCEPYCDAWADKEYKESIKERDNYKCLNPDCFGNIHRLSVHHIDYNKKNCKPQNLITLCVSCNSRANKERKWHTSWYQTIITKRYYENNYR